MHTQKQRRKSYPSDLTLRQFQILAPHLGIRAKKTGRPRSDLKDVVDGILYVLSTGCRWKDLPHDIDTSPSTSHRWLLDFEKKRAWQKIQRELMKEAYRKHKINLNNSYHDASVVKSKRGRNAR